MAGAVTASPVAPDAEFIARVPDGTRVEDYVSLDLPPAGGEETRETAEPVETQQPPVAGQLAVAGRPAKPATVPLGALEAERRERQRYQQLWEGVASQGGGAQDVGGQDPIIIAPTFSESEMADLERRADDPAVKGLGQVTRMLAEEFNKKSTRAANAAAQEARQRSMRAREDAFKRDHPEYDEVIQAAGLWDAIKYDNTKKVFNDPVIGADVYKHTNPGLRLYELAAGKLQKAGRLDAILDRYPRSGQAEVASTPASHSVAIAPAVAAPATNGGEPRYTAAELDEARRRGAQQVTDQVANGANRGRGVRNIPSAGGAPAQVGMSREYLDKLMESNPAAYERLCDENPTLERWHLGG